MSARSADDVGRVEAQVTELLQLRHGIQPGAPNDFSIRNISEFLSAREESSRVMSMLLAAVASVSLIVGGIGIMNIMLVSVTERTREIGLRMAIGAGGRVRSEADRLAAIDRVRADAVDGGFEVVAGSDSGVAGAKSGNVEHFLHLRRARGA